MMNATFILCYNVLSDFSGLCCRSSFHYGQLKANVYKRTELDEQGNPFPLLYMKRKVVTSGSHHDALRMIE